MTRTEARDRLTAFERLYRTSLSAHVRQTPPARIDGQATRLARRARSLGIGSLTLARIHDRAFASLRSDSGETALPPRSSARADAFFAQADLLGGAPPASAAPPPEDDGPAAGSSKSMAARLALARERLREEVDRRKAAQAALVESERSLAALGEESRRMEERLRRLSHRLLNAQEAERIRISRDLHDAIGQTLAGINVGLATLQHEAAMDSRQLAENIAQTQQLVERSMKTVHEFAQELRPTVLDDLGLIPALRSHAQAFAARTGLRMRFAAAPEAAQIDPDRRIALFRVAQEALANVARHAQAREVSVTLRRLRAAVRLEVEDDGKAFDVELVGRSTKNQHLGLLGMQERMDMVGGTFAVESAAGVGTTIRADVPLAVTIG